MSYDAPAPIAGVSLEQYAGVSAALAENIPLDKVLAQEKIDPASWPVAERGWREAMSQSPDVHIAYMQKRRQAEDCLARPIEPLESDAAAWVGLLGALATADSPGSLLDPLGLKMSDVGRLGRHWKRKAEKDAQLAKQLGDLAGKTKPPSRVTAGPVELRRFPWSPPADPATSEGTALGPLDAPNAGVYPIEVDVDLYAALTAVIEVLPHERPTALSLCGINDRKLSQIDAAWGTRLRGDPDLRAEFSVKALDYRAAFRRLLAGAKPAIATKAEAR
jgi:hypothetical protein